MVIVQFVMLVYQRVFPETSDGYGSSAAQLYAVHRTKSSVHRRVNLNSFGIIKQHMLHGKHMQ